MFPYYEVRRWCDITEKWRQSTGSGGSEDYARGWFECMKSLTGERKIALVKVYEDDVEYIEECDVVPMHVN